MAQEELSSHQVDEGICLRMFLVGRMFFAPHFAPLLGFQFGEEGIGLGGHVVHHGEVYAFGQADGLSIQFTSTDDVDVFGVVALHQCFFDTSVALCILIMQSLLTAEYNVASVGQCTFGERLEGLAPHDDSVTRSELLEAFEVVGQAIEQLVVEAYGIIFSYGDNDGDVVEGLDIHV